MNNRWYMLQIPVAAICMFTYGSNFLVVYSIGIFNEIISGVALEILILYTTMRNGSMSQCFLDYCIKVLVS